MPGPHSPNGVAADRRHRALIPKPGLPDLRWRRRTGLLGTGERRGAPYISGCATVSESDGKRR